NGLRCRNIANPDGSMIDISDVIGDHTVRYGQLALIVNRAAGACGMIIRQRTSADRKLAGRGIDDAATAKRHIIENAAVGNGEIATVVDATAVMRTCYAALTDSQIVNQGN